MSTSDVEVLYRRLLDCWDRRDAVGYGELFDDDGGLVGFDGSTVESSASIVEHLRSIFEDHQPATYVARVREIRQLTPDVVLLRSVVGMVPPDGDDINPDVNAVQSLVAVQREGRWRIAHFQNTPAAYHGRPEAAEALTSELRVELHSEKPRTAG
jgi:uncharacterized protein (TIGR02246 family)